VRTNRAAVIDIGPAAAFWVLAVWPRCRSLTIRTHICIITIIVIETVKNQRRSMTLPDERYRALKWAEQFMQDLLDPSKTPRVPKRVRAQARSVLRHYPGSYYIDEIARRAPDIITPRMEELTRFVRSREQDPETTNSLERPPDFYK